MNVVAIDYKSNDKFKITIDFGSITTLYKVGEIGPNRFQFVSVGN